MDLSEGMPADHGLWLGENQRTLPSRTEPPQHHPKELVGRGTARHWVFAYKYSAAVARDFLSGRGVNKTFEQQK